MAFPVESAGAFRVAFRGRSELVSPSDRIPRRRSKSLLRGSCDAVLRIVYGILPRSYPNASGTLRSALSSTTSPFTGSSTMHCNVLDSPCFQIGRDSRDHTFSAEAAPERIFRPPPSPHPLPTLLPDARPKRASVGILTSGREASPRPSQYPHGSPSIPSHPEVWNEDPCRRNRSKAFNETPFCRQISPPSRPTKPTNFNKFGN